MMSRHQIGNNSLLSTENPLRILAQPLECLRQFTDVDYLVLVYGHKGER